MDKMKKLFRRFRKKRQPAAQSPVDMQRLLKMLVMTDEGEIACDDVLLALAEFGEMAQRGENVAEMMPLVEKHLTMCTGCREEYEALIAILAAEEKEG